MKKRLITKTSEVKFKLNETDPLSEGSPAIWENWEDFFSVGSLKN